nr:hypothetical protein [Hymenobacter piscis]
MTENRRKEQANYDYDGVGNLIRDNQAGVTSISWTPYGKIAQVLRPGGVTTSYLYDAQGNRIRKLWAPVGPTKTTYYVRDAQGNPLAIYEAAQGQAPQLVEQPLYGSARLGERKPAAPLSAAAPQPGVSGATYARVLGQKLYELSDHLGNVRAVVTDEKTSTLSASTGKPLTGSLQPVLSAYYNYYAFGQLQPGRYTAASISAGGYRYGYNGQEKSDDITQGHYTADFWEYDSRIGRRWNVDPATKHDQSSYSAFANNPIWFADPLGNDTLKVQGANNSMFTASYGTGTKSHSYKLSDYGINKDIGRHNVDLGITQPDVIGLDLQASGQFTVASAQLGVNVLWHTRGEENPFAPEVHAYHGAAASFSSSSFMADMSASGSVSLFWGWAKQVDRMGIERPAPSSWVGNGYNWTGDFWGAAFSIGEGYQVSGSRFTSLKPGSSPSPGSPYWSGYSLGWGVGASATGGFQKAANFLDALKAASGSFNHLLYPTKF